MKQNKQGALVWVRCAQFPDTEQKQLHKRSSGGKGKKNPKTNSIC